MTSTSPSLTDDEDLEPEEDEFEVVITEALADVEPESITAASPKKYIAAARSGGFDVVKVQTSRTLQAQAPFKTGKRAGEAKPDIDLQHLWLTFGTKGAAAALVHFVDNRFKSARVWDVAGWPMELWASYEPRALWLKQVKDEPERAWLARVEEMKGRALEQDYQYNDGEFWVNRRPRTLTVGIDFEEWLADLVPGFEPRKRPEKKQPATAVELIQIGEWTE